MPTSDETHDAPAPLSEEQLDAIERDIADDLVHGHVDEDSSNASVCWTAVDTLPLQSLITEVRAQRSLHHTILCGKAAAKRVTDEDRWLAVRWVERGARQPSTYSLYTLKEALAALEAENATT